MVDAQAGVAPIGGAEKIPERVDRWVGGDGTQRIDPAVLEQVREGLADFDSKQGIVHPSFGLVYVGLRGYHVVIAGEDYRRSGQAQFSGVSQQPTEPAQLVFEF